jgi:hypothetical protein
MIDGILGLDQGGEMDVFGGLCVVESTLVLALASGIEMTDLGVPFFKGVHHGTPFLLVHSTIVSILAQLVGRRMIRSLLSMLLWL